MSRCHQTPSGASSSARLGGRRGHGGCALRLGAAHRRDADRQQLRRRVPGALREDGHLQPFEKKFGVKVVHDATGTSSQDYAKIRASRGAPGFDVAAALSPPEVDPRRQGEPAREDHREGSAEHQVHVGEGARRAAARSASCTRCSSTRCSTTRTRSSGRARGPTTGSREKRYGAKIKGHVINYNPANLLSVYALIHAAELGGGSADEHGPGVGAAQGAEAVGRRRRHGSAEAAPHFENGEVWISPYWSARAGYYIEPRPSATA